MRKPILIILCFFLPGCGSEYAPSASSNNPAIPSAASGIYVEKAYFDLLEQEFLDTVECTGLEGSFWDVAIFLMPPPTFACTGNNLNGKMCYGEFVKPNKILLADNNSWRHEVIHYLLYKNTGDLDPDHESELFGECSNS